jgi:hypothetical protein
VPRLASATRRRPPEVRRGSARGACGTVGSTARVARCRATPVGRTDCRPGDGAGTGNLRAGEQGSTPGSLRRTRRAIRLGAVTQQGDQLSVATEKSAGGATIRPFCVDIPEDELDDRRRRIAASRWSEKETVADESQGVTVATMQELVRYWGTEYDLRRYETRLNALPQLITEIDGLDITSSTSSRRTKRRCRSS